jgi:hypothetical protein
MLQKLGNCIKIICSIGSNLIEFILVYQLQYILAFSCVLIGISPIICSYIKEKEATKREKIRSETEVIKSNIELEKEKNFMARDIIIANTYKDAIVNSHSNSPPKENDEFNINQIKKLLSQIDNLYGIKNSTNNREKASKTCSNINTSINNDGNDNKEYKSYDEIIKLISIMKGVKDD